MKILIKNRVIGEGMNLECNSECLEIPEDIIEGIKNNEVVLFIGSGASTEGRGVFKTTLYTEIRNELNIEKDISFSELMQIYCDKPHGRKKLIKEIRSRFQYYEQFPEIKRNMTQFFYHLSSIYSIKDIITTNWDTLLERECDCVPIIYEEDIALLDESERKVYKMHGSIENISTLVITKDDYDKCYEELNTNLLGAKIKELLANKMIVFIGYSLEDEDFKKIWELINKNLKKLKPHFYIVSPDERLKERLKDKNVTCIKTIASEFIIKVKERLIKDRFILRREILDKIAWELREKIIEKHEETHKLMSKNKISLLLYSTSYQDGYIHALDRIIAMGNSGIYCCFDYICNSIDSYNEWFKTNYRNKEYYDAAYCQGYANGMETVLLYYGKNADGLKYKIENNYYYLFKQKEEIKNLKQLMERIENFTNKEIIKHANKIVDKYDLNNNEGVVYHHRPFL